MSSPSRISSRLRFLRYLRQGRGPASEAADGRPARARPLWRLLYELYRLVEGQRARIAVALLSLSIGVVLKLVPPAATKVMIDHVLAGRPLAPWLTGQWPVLAGRRGQLVLLFAVVLPVGVMARLAGLFGRWQSTLASKHVQTAVRKQVFEHVARLPLHRVQDLKAGGTASMLREDAGSVGELIVSLLYNPWRAAVQLLGGLLVLAWIDWRLLACATSLLPLSLLSEWYWDRWLRPLNQDIRLHRQEIDATNAEVFGGMRTVRAFGRVRTEAARFVNQNNFLVRLEFLSWRRARGVEVAWDLVMPAASSVLLLWGGLRVVEGRLSLGGLMMFLVYLAMLLEPLSVIATTVTQLQLHLASFDRVLDLLAEPCEMASRPGMKTVARGAAAGRITLEGVGFTYPGSTAPVLHDINLDAEPGQVIALVGPSGAGKTTLCHLIARFYDPTAGVIRLGGVDLRDLDVESYRRLFGIVEQDVYLFDGTIAENIAYADPRAWPARIRRAARLANADEFIDRLPERYRTRIGEGGVRLSGGQRQRLAIARAMLAEPAVLILDEATSHLDGQNEAQTLRGLRSLMRGRTTFVIGHRLHAIRRADWIVVLESGRIVEAGRHAELAAHPGRYRDLVRLQQGRGV